MWPWTTVIRVILFFIDLYWINKLSINIWLVSVGQYLAEIQLFEYLKSEGEFFFYMFTVENIKNIFMEHDLYLIS